MKIRVTVTLHIDCVIDDILVSDRDGTDRKHASVVGGGILVGDEVFQ